MKTMGKKAIIFLLAACMLLSLAACGKDKDGGGEDAQQLSGTVYVPEYIDLGLEENSRNRMVGACTDGKNVYMLSVKYPDYEAGETGDSVYSLQSISLETRETASLPNFKADAVPEGYDQGGIYYDGIRSAADGTLWLSASAYGYSFDLPEDFDKEKDEYWNYDVKSEMQEEYQIQLDSTGTEITRITTTDLREKSGVESFYSDGTVFGADGNVYIATEGKVVVMDSSMNILFTLEDESLWGGNLITLSDGRLAVMVSVSDTLNETYTRQLKTIDTAGKDWGEVIELPSRAYDLYSGGGEYLFYYQIGETLYGYKAEAAEGEEREVRLLNWMEADLPVDDLSFFTFLEDGRLVVMARAWGGRLDGSSENLAVLTPTDRSELPEKTYLTYATMYLGQEERNEIISFNRANQNYRIEVKDYSEFNTDEDYSAGTKKLNTEILAGQIPDIINTSSLPVRQYGAKGILEDLWPYIENDAEIGGRAGLMERPFTAAEQDGKLYYIFSTFGIQTLAGAASVVGERNSWTLADMQEALAKMPEGCSLLSQYNTKSGMLNAVVNMNLDHFVNWDTGECGFDSQEFKDMLAFCNSFPAEYDYKANSGEDYDDEPTRVADGRQMLMSESITNFKDIQMHKAIFGGAVSYVGYPREDGSVGSTFYAYSGLAMSAACKDKEGAWSFMRQTILPKYAGTEDYDGGWGMGGGFFSNKKDFEWMVEQSMTPSGYETDENGERVLDEDGNPIETSNSGWSWGSVSVDIMSTKQDEYDQIMDLYNKVERMGSSDESITEIVSDVSGGYFAGDRTLDDTAAQIQNRVKLYVDESR